ncbi:MAG: signal recognition particle-docking protein FtsY [Candidatus Aminicenantes bacterium]|nr:signal recognition particle-docking protein FtsY [Candidatus Aminicenantes bacterium]
MKKMVFSQLQAKLYRTRQILKEKIQLFGSKTVSKEKALDELAEALILADVGVATTEKIIASLRRRIKEDSSLNLEQALKQELLALLGKNPPPLNFNCVPVVIMLVGVNGGGKTTSLAKLAYYLKKQGKQVMLVAADTFRAAAQEQLQIWSRKLDLPLIRGQYGADPAAVVYDALQALKARKGEALLIDTAGRIHTNSNLMAELEKIKRVISREINGAPHEVLLVLDASIGQNALSQAREFLKFSGLTGIFLSKLDGTAKGGAALAIAAELNLPIKFLGIGESESDMLLFSPQDFINALLS